MKTKPVAIVEAQGSNAARKEAVAGFRHIVSQGETALQVRIASPYIYSEPWGDLSVQIEEPREPLPSDRD